MTRVVQLPDAVVRLFAALPSTLAPQMWLATTRARLKPTNTKDMWRVYVSLKQQSELIAEADELLERLAKWEREPESQTAQTIALLSLNRFVKHLAVAAGLVNEPFAETERNVPSVSYRCCNGGV